MTSHPIAGRNNPLGQPSHSYALANNVLTYMPSFSAHKIFSAMVLTLSVSLPHLRLAVTNLNSGIDTGWPSVYSGWFTPNHWVASSELGADHLVIKAQISASKSSFLTRVGCAFMMEPRLTTVFL
eukprot:4087319-Ditylum_brightwellii.AAC.1